MRRTIWASSFALATAAVLVGSEASAAGDWGLHTGDTMRGGDFMPYGEFGWPDISLGFQYGLSPKVDIGARLSLLYGVEYTTATNIGMGLRVPIRISLTKRPKFSALLHIDPGFKFYANGYDSFGYYCGRFGYCGGYYRNNVLFGIQFPFGVEFGIHVTPDATINIGIDLPMSVFFASQALFVTGPLTGFGFEYHVDDHFGVGLNTRFGPMFFVQNGTGATFGFITQLGLMYRI